MRAALLRFAVVAAIALLVVAHASEDFAEDYEYEEEAEEVTGPSAHVLSLQQCKGSSTWTVHGLWPQSDKNCKGDALDVKALGDTLVGKLKTGWPSCPGGKSNEDFWKHEWQKHGRCSGLTQSGYFEKSLALASGFDYKKDCIMTKSECRSCWDADFKLTKC